MTATQIDIGDGLPLTIPRLIRHWAAATPDAVLLATDTSQLTYGEADRLSRQVAKALIAAGAEKGTHIALLLPNGPEFIVSMLAVARIGAVVLPLSTLSTAAELRQLIIQSDAAMLICANGYRSRDYRQLLADSFTDFDAASPQPLQLRDAVWLERVWFVEEGWPTASMHVEDALLDAIEARVTPSDRFVIIHTSGSTGQPKGVIHSHGALLRHIDNINQIRHFGAEDALFSTSPWFWIAGFAFALIGTLSAGARLVVSNSQIASEVLDLLERERPTLTNGYAPSVAWLAQDKSFAKRDFSWLRRGNLWPIMAADARPCDPSWRHDLYGTSETGSGLSMSSESGDLPEHLRGAAGKLLPGIEGKVVDPETGQECAPGQIGELWVRGPFLMEGYYGQPRHEVFEPDGWWRTSDAVIIDEQGYVFLKGRLGTMIKTAGANVSPREVEAATSELTGCFCVVVGAPDPDRGQLVIAVLFSDPPAVIDEAELREQLGKRLSSYKVPRRILSFASTDMPLLSSGKVDNAALMKLVEARVRVSAE